MTDDEYVTIIVLWKEQRRPIKIKVNDDINAIEKTISTTYQLREINSLDEYQIQYYDTDNQSFMDLYSETFDVFQRLLRKLLSPEAPPKPSKEWKLRIVPKTIENTRHSLRGSINDDTYNYQQENDPTEFLQNKETLGLPNNQSTAIQSSLSSRSDNDDSDHLDRVPSSQNTDEDQSETVQLPRMDSIKPELVITSDHPYGLDFHGTLADHQRQQFEGEMIRKVLLKKTVGGCFVRASYKSDDVSNKTESYPIIHFQIPQDQHNLKWLMHVYVLTERDNDGKYYLHASKGVFDNWTKREDKFGIIPNTELVNPHVIILTQDNIRDGQLQLRIKVCNIKNLCTHKHEFLREFPHLNTPIIYDDKSLLSEKTTVNLSFSSEKYHLGCILVSDHTKRDRCISSLTIAETSRKRNEPDKRKPQDDGNQEEKRKRTENKS